MKKNGFSLVELLVLLAVIAALIAIIPIAGNTIQRLKATRIARTMDTISLLAEEKLLREGPFFFSNLSDDSGLRSLVQNATEEYRLLVLITHTGEVFTTVMYIGSGVDTELITKLLPNAFVAERSLKYTLLNGDYFYNIRWEQTITAIGLPEPSKEIEIAYVPEGYLCLTRSYTIY